MNALRTVLHVLRADPDQWRRRGLRSPREIAVLVAERSLPDDPSYGDFFVPSP
ncbi:hypothetical protein Q7F20_04730 [Curtobacterium sp. A7_M15]|uniref:hypothetical protein n=1 Tax=Curtobacterium sp. A7_M15 TaxID=3065241 RepID=UPI00273783A3|nr:hypothetical protein [Curtobacterium sp. A7_M15]MDP4332664.1 hypothetical protein [Curtobacterium sp. A7_M15]